MTPWRGAPARLALCAVLGLHATGAGAFEQRSKDGWRPELLEQWLSAGERTVPGSLDRQVIAAAGWSGQDLRKLCVDVQVLLDIVKNPEHNRFVITPLTYESKQASRPVVTFKTGERAILDALAKRVRTMGLNPTLRRATVL